MVDKATIIDTLKKSIDIKFHDLNDWDAIFDDRELYEDDIYIYKCSFVDLYVHDDGNFYTADPHIPPSFNVSDNYNQYTDDELEIISVLKSYIDGKSYDLNDWSSIIKNSVTDKDGITRYDLSFGTLYLDKNNEYYDVEPIEIDSDVDVLMRNCTDEELSIIPLIKQYVPSKYYDLINWSVVLNNVEEVSDNVYHYPLTIMDLYLDKDYKPVTYESCYVINNDFYYDFNPKDVITDGQLTFITTLN